jgi:tetratricopeptide (TPR) repeat protein/transcriptional regulator with XRE-family HTH domain
VGAAIGESPVGSLTRAHRRRLGMSQEELAAKAGLAVRTVRNIELGCVGPPRRSSVGALADALGLAGRERTEYEAVARRTRADVGWEVRPPFQLPPDLADFTGREGTTADLVTALSSDGPAVRVAVVAGRPGVGKTTLAVHVARRLRSVFPDGQVFVRMQTGEGRPLSTVDLLGQLLRALNVDGGRLPDGVEERAALFRSLLSGLRVVFLLDDAVDAAHVRPLLPGAPGSAVLITSRSTLTGLTCATRVDLDVLDQQEAVTLLGQIVGGSRVETDPVAARDVVGYCGRLPLAVRIAGARLATRPGRPLSWLADRLADAQHRLDELVADDLAVRASVSLSYQALGPAERAAFRRLALLDVPDFAAWLVAAVLDAPSSLAEVAVERLVDAHLLDIANEAGPAVRYRFHDLLRVYACERVRTDETAEDRTATVLRAMGAALDFAENARRGLSSDYMPLNRCEADRWTVAPAVSAAAAENPLIWLEAERETLVRLVGQAGDTGSLEYAWGLATTLYPFLELRRYFDDLDAIHSTLLDGARVWDDPEARAYGFWVRGETEAARGHYENAIQHLDVARGMFQELGHQISATNILSELSNSLRLAGERARAEACSRELIELSRTLGGGELLALALHDLGALAIERENYEFALDNLEKSYNLFVEHGNIRCQGLVLLRLGQLYPSFGRNAQAILSLQRCLAIVCDSADQVGEAHALLALGDVFVRQARVQEARTLFSRASDLFDQTKEPLGGARALLKLGQIAQAEHDVVVAETVLREALGRLESTGAKRWQALVRATLGDVLAEPDATPRHGRSGGERRRSTGTWARMGRLRLASDWIT